MAPGVQLKLTWGLSQRSIAWPATQMRRSAVLADMDVSLLPRSGRRARADRVEVEAGAAEVAAKLHDSGVDQASRHGDDLGLARRALGEGLHQIEQSEPECHRPTRPFRQWAFEPSAQCAMPALAADRPAWILRLVAFRRFRQPRATSAGSRKGEDAGNRGGWAGKPASVRLSDSPATGIERRSPAVIPQTNADQQRPMRRSSPRNVLFPLLA